MSSNRTQITPNPPRWKPNPDPASIVVPGLDTDASVTDQIEQIEQLITIKLQNIDENFSKIHNALANKLLPAVKRYAVGTEPVREAAKFWTSFYEQAAQIRIPTFDDYSTVNENTSEREDAETSSQEHADTTVQYRTRTDQDEYGASTVNSETSFLPGQGAFSSTPAISRAATSNNDSYANQPSEHPSWTHSLESPLVRLNREINNLSTETADESLLPPPQSVGRSAPDFNASVESTFKHDVSVLPASEKGKGKDTSHPLLRNVLRHNLYSTNDSSSFDSKKVSPLKFRAKPKTPIIDKSRNPYLPEQASPAEWSGIVDLRDPSILTPKRIARPAKMAAATPYDDDDSFDGLPPGMSPPVLMSPARPPRSSAELGLLKLGQTPARDATARIQRDLIRDAQLKSGGNKSDSRLYGRKGYYESSTSLSTAMTPPSLSRYNRGNEYSTDSNITKDSSLESMIRHIRNDIRPDAGTTSASSASVLRVRSQALEQIHVSAAGLRVDQPQAQPCSPALSELATPMYNPVQPQHDDLDSDSDSLDIDEINNTAHPSAAFLMASQGGQFNDDNSFGSSNNSSDSLGDEDIIGAAGIVPVHPFAQSGPVVEDDGFDDDDSESFDGFETQPGAALGSSEYQDETVFGLAPAGRMASGGDLRMLGDDLDTAVIDRRLGFHRPEEQSPTPNLWAPR